MSQAFKILSEALDEAIRDAKSEKPFLKRDTLSIKIEKEKNFASNQDDNETLRNNKILNNLTA